MIFKKNKNEVVEENIINVFSEVERLTEENKKLKEENDRLKEIISSELSNNGPFNSSSLFVISNLKT